MTEDWEIMDSTHLSTIRANINYAMMGVERVEGATPHDWDFTSGLKLIIKACRCILDDAERLLERTGDH